MSKKEITPAQIEQWKKEHVKVFYAESDGHKAYYKKPSRKELSYALTLKEQPIDMYEMLLKNCFLGGDPILHEDPSFLLGCIDLAEKMLAVKCVEVGEA